jgi:5'-3' exonuclease
MTGKYTLVFDANFFLHKTYFIGQKIKTGKPFNFIDEPESDKNLLLWKLAMDFASEIKRFEGVVNRVVYAIDSSSWRKKFLDTQYKANRVKSESINWNAIYECHTEFATALEKCGVIVSRVKGAEADDLIFAWTSVLNQNGQNAIIISGDNDLLQLVNKDNSSGANTIYYNKFDKDIHVFPKFQNWIEVDDHKTTHDIFNLPLDLMSNVKQSLRDIIKSNKMKHHEVNVNEFLFRKILIGDSGDNVPPLHTVVKQTKAGPRTYGVTDKHVNEINSRFKDDKVYINQSHFFTNEHIYNICSIAKDVIKIDRTVEEIYERWIINRDLVYLHNNCIPKEVTSLMLEDIEQKQMKTLSGVQLSNVMAKDSILEYTTYTKEKKTEFNESGLFKSLGVEEDKPKAVNVTEDNSGFDTNFWNDLIK